jgi:hypothetical protein
VRVNGKGSFLTYLKMLNCFNIKYLILGDLDCYKDEVQKLCRYLNIKSQDQNLEKIKKAIESQPHDIGQIADRIKGIDKNFDAQKLEDVFSKFQAKTISNDDKDLTEIIQFMKERYVKADKRKIIIDSIGNEEFEKVQNTLRENGIFIWSKGDLETYYTDTVKQMNGSKDIKPLQLSYKLKEAGSVLENYLKEIDEIKLLVEHVLN